MAAAKKTPAPAAARQQQSKSVAKLPSKPLPPSQAAGKSSMHSFGLYEFFRRSGRIIIMGNKSSSWLFSWNGGKRRGSNIGMGGAAGDSFTFTGRGGGSCFLMTSDAGGSSVCFFVV